MSKRFLVPLDPSEYATSALRLACQQAAADGGTVIVLGVVDVPGIESSESAAPLGAAGFAKKAREHKIREAQETVERLLASGEAACCEHGVTCERELRTGVPVEEVVRAAETADLVVVGVRSFLHFATSEGPCACVEELLRQQACPVLVVPKDLVLPYHRVLVPFDGSIQSARSMRLFATYMESAPFTKDIELLCVEDDIEEGLKRLQSPARYLTLKGFHVTPRVLPGSPKEVLLEEAKREGPGLVVVGASGRSALKTLLFVSVTHTLLEDGSVSLFVST
jgi:nucleotide-binding universal stress UspA family protein